LQKRISDAGINNANVQVIQPSPLPGLEQPLVLVCRLSSAVHTDNVHAFEKVVNNFVTEANKNPAISKAFSFFTAHTPNLT
jgi:hypothetical protein